jgi:pyruvate kinase
MEVLGVTNSLQVMRKMCLYWGITPYFFLENEEDLSTLQEQMIEQLKTQKMVQNGDKIVITHGDGKFFKQGTSNSIRVEIIKDAHVEDKNSKKKDAILQENITNGRIILDTAQCASCQSCINICPHDIWVRDENNDTIINAATANDCARDMECVSACPTGAIEIISTDI